MDAFIKLQLNYCPVLWMFHDRGANAKLNKIFERALRITCHDSGNKYVDNYYNINKSLTIHQNSLQLLMTEINKERIKTKNNFNPPFMKDIYAEKNNIAESKKKMYGTENIQLRGCFLWSSLFISLKDSDTLQECKRQWDASCCNFILCKVFIKDLGFLD